MLMETLVPWLIGLGVVAYVISRFKETEYGRRFWASVSGDTPQALTDRNRNIIIRYIGKVQANGGGYDIDNLTRDCISEIARKERRPTLAPGPGEWLYRWEQRSDIPSEWLHLKERIKAALNAKHSEVLKKHSEVLKEQSKKEEERKAFQRKQLYLTNKDLIEKFFEIAERKVSIIDEYGEENWDALPWETETCITKIAKRNGHSEKAIKQAFKKGFWFSGIPEEYEWLQSELNEAFREYHRAQKARPANSFKVDGLTGVEFETSIARLLMERGFEVSGTAATGDQGADLIAKKNGRTIIIQAKCYQGTVGNKAVQEVISAVAYYGGDEGWVITNSLFTPSAKALAQKSNVRLVDGKTLERGTLD